MLRPRLTVVALGTNDAFALAFGDAGAVAGAERGLRRLGRLARRSGSCVILVPPRFGTLGAAVDEVSDRIRATAATAGCATSDALVRELDAPADRLADGVHPTPSGVARLADALLPVITTRLRRGA